MVLASMLQHAEALLLLVQGVCMPVQVCAGGGTRHHRDTGVHPELYIRLLPGDELAQHLI